MISIALRDIGPANPLQATSGGKPSQQDSLVAAKMINMVFVVPGQAVRNRNPAASYL